MTIGIGIWGMSDHSINKLLPSILKNEEFQFKGFLSRKSSKKSVLNHKVFNSKESFLKDKTIDIIIICTPPALHYDNAKDAMKAGKNIIVEKPITISLENSIELCELAEKNKLLLIEGFYYKYDPYFKIMKEKSNHILNTSYSINSYFTIPTLKRKSFRNIKSLGASSFWDIGCYPMSLIYELFKNKIDKINIIRTFLYHDSNNIDKLGYTFLNFKNFLSINLYWGIDLSYKNYFEIFSTNKSLKFNYIFSKKKENLINFEEFDRYGNKKVIEIKNKDSINEFLKILARNMHNYNFKNKQLTDIKNLAKFLNKVHEKYVEIQ